MLYGSEVWRWLLTPVGGCRRRGRRSFGSGGKVASRLATLPGLWRSAPVRSTRCSKPPAGLPRASDATAVAILRPVSRGRRTAPRTPPTPLPVRACCRRRWTRRPRRRTRRRPSLTKSRRTTTSIASRFTPSCRAHHSTAYADCEPFDPSIYPDEPGPSGTSSCGARSTISLTTADSPYTEPSHARIPVAVGLVVLYHI